MNCDNSKVVTNTIEWESLPLIYNISEFLYKSDVIELSKVCKYFRNKLEPKIFYSLSLFKSKYFNNFKINRPKLSALELKLELVNSINRDLSKKNYLVKEIILKHRVNPITVELITSTFVNCERLIVSSKYYLKLSTLIKFTNKLKLKVIYLEGLSGRVHYLLSIYKCIFPLTIEFISVPWYFFNNNLALVLNTVNFSVYSHLATWKITGNFNLEKFLKPQPTIKKLYLVNHPAVEHDKLKTLFLNNSQLECLTFYSIQPSFEIIQEILNLPNLKTLQICFILTDLELPQIYKLTKKSSISHLLLTANTQLIIIEALLNCLANLTQLTLSSSLLRELEQINWKKLNNLKIINLTPNDHAAQELKQMISKELPETKILFKSSISTNKFGLSI